MIRSLKKQIGITMMSLVVFAAAPHPLHAADAPAKKPTLVQYVHQTSTKILDQLEADNDIATARKSATELFEQVTLYSPDDRLDAIREADFCERLTEQMAALPDEQRVDTLKFVRKNTDLANALVFLVRIDEDKVDKVYALLNQLREKHADELNKFANLTAAICVVRDAKLVDHVNENKVEAADAVAVWEYYVKNEKKMFFGLKNVPAELLEYVVDTTSTPDQMEWALAKYAGDKQVGRHFFDIKYDTNNLHLGTEKKVTAEGYTLQNILKYGGVCVDQAYFATTVGKAIGVPTALTVGSAAEAGHAWVGFLEADGRNGAWNFNIGRYAAYQGVRGTCRDPQSLKGVPDNYVSLLGELITTGSTDRQNCIAVTDIALRLQEAMKEKQTLDTPAPADCAAGTLRPKVRKADVETILTLVDLALHQSAGYAPAWFEVRDLAVDNQLSLADKRHWSDVLLRLGASKYPDFTLAILTPMVQTVPDVKDQDAMWKALLPLFKTRFDLTANIMMSEAAMWEANNQPDKAGQLYLQVVDQYANAGPFIIGALAGAEKLLVSTNRGDKVVQLYEQTWKQIKEPQQMAQMFLRGSSWYRVGKLYAEKLKASGDEAKAESVTDQINHAGAPDLAAK